MQGLLEELTARGALDAAAIEWAQRYCAEHEEPLDTALLVLDLVDEDVLLEALSAVSALPAASAGDLAVIDTEVGSRLPRGFGDTFGLCPLQMSGHELVALVRTPLTEDSLAELRELFQLEVRQKVATSHQLALARGRVYGSEVEALTRSLEARLVRRRAADVRRVLAAVSSAASLRAAAVEIIDFAAARLEYACLLVCGPNEIKVAAEAGERRIKSATLAVPQPGATLWAAIANGGYFLGRVVGTPADEAFYASLGRPVPRWALVAPVPVAGDRKVVFYGDNGERGIATRWVAELSLLVARLIEQPASRPQEIVGGATGQSRPEEPRIERTEEEQLVLDRLRAAADREGSTLVAFVDRLLGEPTLVNPAAEPTAALVGEVKDLFQRLAADIPAQLARGMENAFRDMIPRIAAPEVAAPRAAVSSSRAPAAADLLVVAESKPREVSDYRARRRKSKRVKL